MSQATLRHERNFWLHQTLTVKKPETFNVPPLAGDRTYPLVGPLPSGGTWNLKIMKSLLSMAQFSKSCIHGIGTPKTRGAFEGELTVNEVIKNNEDTESTWKMTLPSLRMFLTRLVRISSVTNEAIFQKLNFLFSKYDC